MPRAFHNGSVSWLHFSAWRPMTVWPLWSESQTEFLPDLDRCSWSVADHSNFCCSHGRQTPSLAKHLCWEKVRSKSGFLAEEKHQCWIMLNVETADWSKVLPCPRPGLVEVGTFMDPKMHQRYFAKIMINQATVATIISNFRLRFDLCATFCNMLQLGLLSFLFLILMHPDNQENISWKIPSIQSSRELDPDVLAAQYDRYEVRLLDPLRYNMLQQLCLNHKGRIISAVASEIEHVLETAGATLVATAGTSDSETQIRSRAPRLKGGMKPANIC